ncbi:MAG: ABC transporter permease [Propionibacteriaceae bacterium]|nr:ABC transporter permease [Propionibacteriaceae bacterium]
MTTTAPNTTARTTSRPSESAPRGGFWRRFAALVAGETRILVRNKTALFTAVALPLFMAVAFSGLAMGREQLGLVLTLVVIGSALMFVLYYTMVSSLVARREQLVLKRLYAGEPTPLEILLAPAVPLWGLFVVQAGLGIAGALVLGTPIAHPWALALALIGGAAAWTALAIWSATWTRTLESAQLTTMPLIIVSMLLSGFSLPLDIMPALVQRVAHWLPMTPVIDLINLAFLGTGIDGTVLTGRALLTGTIDMLIPLVLWTVAALNLGLRGFRWDARG